MTEQRVFLSGGPAYQDRSYPMPELPEGIDVPPALLYLEKPVEGGGKITFHNSPRFISELYRLAHERHGPPSREDGNLVYWHVPDSQRDGFAEKELDQRRQWCPHRMSIVISRETPEGWVPGTRYCHDCKQQVGRP